MLLQVWHWMHHVAIGCYVVRRVLVRAVSSRELRLHKCSQPLIWVGILAARHTLGWLLQGVMELAPHIYRAILLLPANQLVPLTLVATSLLLETPLYRPYLWLHPTQPLPP